MVALFSRDETDHLHVSSQKEIKLRKNKRFATPYKLWLWCLPYILPNRNWVCIAGTPCHPFYGNYKPN